MRPPPICMLNPIIVVGTFLASVKLTEWSGQYLVLTYFFNSSKAVLDLVQSSTELNWTLHSPGFASADKFDKHPLHVSTQHSQLHLPSAPNSRRITASRYNIFVVTRPTSQCLNVSMSQWLISIHHLTSHNCVHVLWPCSDLWWEQQASRHFQP